MTQNPPINTRESWLADRLTGLGASEAATVLGLNPFQSPFGLWAEKTGHAEPDDLSENEAVEFGLRLEGPVIDAFAARTKRDCVPWAQFTSVRHPEYPWLRCTPDGLQTGGHGRDEDGTLQIKTTSAFNSADWHEGIPLHYAVQCQVELAVLGLNWGTLAVLIGGQRLKWFDFERNDEFIDLLIPRLRAFWDLVEAKIPPPVDDRLATAKVLAKLHPEDNGETIELPAEAAEWDERLLAIKDELKALEQEKTGLENKFKSALSDATWGVLPAGGRYSWKTQTRAEHIVKESTFRVLRRSDK